jgi:regulator of replication initiation timing
LKTSYGRFEEALRSFIAAEVETQVQAKEQEAVPLKEYVQALNKQNRELKAENERLSETLENLKNANWVDTLRMKRQLKV